MEKSKIYELSLFIFRRDLRLIDNTGLNLANFKSNNIIPAFFFDKRQIDPKENQYFSSNSVQFMVESLMNLDSDLKKKNSKLFLFHGDLNKNLEQIIKETKIQAIFVNEDYTPFSINRDKEIKELCQKYNVEFISSEDLLLTGLDKVKLSNGNFYKKYTPYYNSASLIKIPSIFTDKKLNFISHKTNLFDNLKNKKENEIKIFNLSAKTERENLEEILSFLKITQNKTVEVHGGRDLALVKLESIKNQKDYKNTRNFPIIPSTKLSAYIKYGCVSVREVFYTVKDNFGPQHDLIRQLHWRDFYMKITYYFPHVIGDAMKPNYSNIKWEADEKHIELWKNGNTGFPIVDSAMRCLNSTGYMHNRLRMIVSSFFVKDILGDWRIGEKYFANKLVDYDISLNNGGWQWSSSTGTDSQPYFRIFNPALQAEKFDKNCEFIFKWIPELKKCEKKHVHDWEKFHGLYKNKVEYPIPILKHAEQKEKAIGMYKALYSGKDEELKENDDMEVDSDTEIIHKKGLKGRTEKKDSKSSDSKKKSGKVKAENQIDIISSFKKGKKK